MCQRRCPCKTYPSVCRLMGIRRKEESEMYEHWTFVPAKEAAELTEGLELMNTDGGRDCVVELCEMLPDIVTVAIDADHRDIQIFDSVWFTHGSKFTIPHWLYIITNLAPDEIEYDEGNDILSMWWD